MKLNHRNHIVNAVAILVFAVIFVSMQLQLVRKAAGEEEHLHEHQGESYTHAQEPHDHDAESSEGVHIQEADTEEHAHDDEGEHHAHDSDREDARMPHNHDVESCEDHVVDHEHHSEDSHEEAGINLTREQEEHFGIEMERAGPGRLNHSVVLPGEITADQNRLVHIASRVAGIVLKTTKNVGDTVRAGEVIAEIDSRGLADMKADYLAARERAALTETIFQREESLMKKKITSEQDYLDARQAMIESRIQLNSAKQKLSFLGFSEKYIEGLADKHFTTFTRYEIRAPIDGTVIEKNISLGESLEENSEIYAVVDLSSVWVDLTVYLKDLHALKIGQEVEIRSDYAAHVARGNISIITPFADRSTRTAATRIVIDNKEGYWRPGTFVTGHISISGEEAPVTVKKDAVQVFEGEKAVFIGQEGEYVIKPVKTGRSDRKKVEILDGIEAGMRYVAKGAFNLKAAVITSGMDPHAGHGH